MSTCKEKTSLSPLVLDKEYILKKLRDIRPIYEKEGLILLGLFGSYALDRATLNSDVDILYDIEPTSFCKKNPGFKAFTRINEIKEELKKDIDLATIDNDSSTFKNFALKGAIYV